MQPHQNHTVFSPLHWPARKSGGEPSRGPGEVVQLPLPGVRSQTPAATRPVNAVTPRTVPDMGTATHPAAVAGNFHAVVLMPQADPRRSALAGGLWDVGMLVTAFSTLREAEGVLVGEHVHAVLVDARVGLPEVATLCQWLKAAGRGHVRVVVMGEEVPMDARVALLSAGVSCVVPRPSEVGTFARQFAAAMGLCAVPWR